MDERITLSADATTTYDTNAAIAIKGSLTPRPPSTVEVWRAGSTQSITWTKTGTIVNVKLQYSTDNFVTPVTIVSSTGAAGGSYSWVVPDIASTNVKVRVTNTGDTTVFDDSNTAFTIKGGLAVTAPVGTDVWTVGAVKTISWTSTGAGAIPTVNLEYSKNGLFNDTVVIATAVASGPTGGSYSWTVGDAIGSTVKVRVKHATDATVSADSAAFTVKGSLALTAPVGGEAWAVGATRNITWTRQGSIANVKVEYSKDNFATPILITASTSAASLTYAWTVPDDVSTTVKVRNTDLNDATVTSTSPANFSIKGSLTITAPNGGESWPIGSTQTITWTKTGTMGNVRLEYSTDGGTNYTVITASTPATSSPYSWVVPDAPTAQARVKITSIDDTSVNDTSDANFGIKGTVTLTAPNGAETWLVGESRNITWTKTGTIANVKLEYSPNGTFSDAVVIAASAAAAGGSYAWTVPDAISATVRVRITNVDDTSVTSSSGSNFKIQGAVTLTAPNGGETWIVGENRNITWTRIGSIANVKLEYSANGTFSDAVTIAASPPAAGGRYACVVPHKTPTDVKVRISDASDATVTDISNANFTIQASLTLTSTT